MKVLWLVNITLPAAAVQLGVPSSNTGGWLTGMLAALDKEKHQYTICSFSPFVTERVNTYIDGVEYLVLPSDAAQKETEQMQAVLMQVKPDVVHIHGTETARAYNMLTLCKCPAVVSIQGLIYVYAQHYFDGLPAKYKHTERVKSKLLRLMHADGGLINENYKEFSVPVETEKETLRLAHNYIGRTSWDKYFTEVINPDAQYFYCNETLRPEFYLADKWQYDTCEPHTLFVSQGHYPIKGMHMLLRALALVKRQCPNVRVYVAGKSPFPSPKRGRDKLFGRFVYEYQGYLQHLMRKGKLEGNLIFLGSLTAKEMVAIYQRVNAFVLPSAMENSPNSLGEAMLIGTPCIASRVGGVADMLQDGEEGLLYPFEDVAMLAQHILHIFEMGRDVQSITARAISHAEKTHSPAINANTLTRIYETLQQS